MISIVNSNYVGRGSNVSVTNQFKEYIGKLGNEEKQKKPKKYLQRVILKIWKGDALQNKNKKLRYKSLLRRAMVHDADGKFDIARAQGRLHGFKRLKNNALTKVNKYVYTKLYDWYKGLPQGHSSSSSPLLAMCWSESSPFDIV